MCRPIQTKGAGSACGDAELRRSHIKTGAPGSYTMEFDHYDEVPGHLADKVIANGKAGTSGEEEEEE